jgi:hypothetical protein
VPTPNAMAICFIPTRYQEDVEAFLVEHLEGVDLELLLERLPELLKQVTAADEPPIRDSPFSTTSQRCELSSVLDFTHAILFLASPSGSWLAHCPPTRAHCRVTRWTRSRAKRSTCLQILGTLRLVYLRAVIYPGKTAVCACVRGEGRGWRERLCKRDSARARACVCVCVCMCVCACACVDCSVCVC